MALKRGQAVVHSFCLLIICSLVLYNIDLRSLNNPEDRPRPAHFASVWSPEVEDRGEGQEPNRFDIWVSMALCWSSNTHYWGKDQFPYKEAAPMSSKLWMKIVKVKVMLQVVYSEPHPTDELIKYKADLEDHGAVVKLIPKANNIKCVLEAQLIRMLAYLYDEIKGHDVMITADVDAFPMTRSMVAPIRLLPDRKIWLYRYGLSLGTGNTFMMPFIGAKAEIWRSILKYDTYNADIHPDIGQGIKGWVDKYGKYMNFGSEYTWEVDQHISSRAILDSGLCSLPADNSLWKELNLTVKVFEDNSTCWHGFGIWEDCNNELTLRNAIIRHRGGNCKWWHFYPSERYPALKSKFDEIMAGTHEDGILNTVLGVARKLEFQTFGKIIGP